MNAPHLNPPASPDGTGCAHYISHRAVRSLFGRQALPGAGAHLPRLAVAADVVEVQAPSARRRASLVLPRSALRSPFPFTEFLAPYNASVARHTDYIRSPPQFDPSLPSRARFVGPFTYGTDYALDMTEPCGATTHVNKTKVQPIKLLLPRRSLRLFWGVIRARRQASDRLSGGGWHPVSSPARTGWAATCSRASSTARACR